MVAPLQAAGRLVQAGARYVSTHRALAAAVAVPLSLGSVVGVATLPAVFSWYIPKLAKPWWAPPAPVFGQVWSLLYVGMGVASHRAAAAVGWRSPTMALYAAQLALNLAWQPLFFVLKRPDLAQADNAALLLAAAATGAAFRRADALAGALMLPYVMFVAYANALNYSVWRRNPPSAFAAATAPPPRWGRRRQDRQKRAGAAGEAAAAAPAGAHATGAAGISKTE